MSPCGPLLELLLGNEALLLLGNEADELEDGNELETDEEPELPLPPPPPEIAGQQAGRFPEGGSERGGGSGAGGCRWIDGGDVSVNEIIPGWIFEREFKGMGKNFWESPFSYFMISSRLSRNCLSRL